MPFDPAWPQNGQNIDADRIRGQFAGIIDRIGSGAGINAAEVDNTNTLPPSTPANASVSVVRNKLHFVFEAPQGQEGLVGPAGPPFAQAVVDAVNTVNPGDPAAVGVTFDGTKVPFTFGIPRGNDGTPGEVSAAQLSSAIDGTSNNSNSVGTLGLSVSDPPAQAEMQSLANKLDELINALRR